MSGTMLIHFILQLVSIALILHVFRTDERFAARGSHLGKSSLGPFAFAPCPRS